MLTHIISITIISFSRQWRFAACEFVPRTLTQKSHLVADRERACMECAIFDVYLLWTLAICALELSISARAAR